MAAHEVWHVLVLVTVLAGAGAAVLLVLAPLLFEAPPPGLTRARPLLVAVIAVAVTLLVVEWLAVH